MKVSEAIKTRRAIKHYDPKHEMTDQEVETLLSLAAESPTAYNIQNVRFVRVKDKKLRDQLKEAAWGQEQVTDASLLLVVTADLKAWEKDPKRYWQNAPQEVQEFILPMIDGYYRDKPQVERDEAMRSCGIIAQTIMLAAREMDYDSCPMDGFDFTKAAEIINLPKDHVIALFIVVGKKTKDSWPKPGQLRLDELVIEYHF